MRLHSAAALGAVLLACSGGGEDGGGGGGAAGPAWRYRIGAAGDWTDVAISADGSRVLAASDSGIVMLRSDGTAAWTAPPPADGWVTDADLSSDGTWGAVATNSTVSAIGTSGVLWTTSPDALIPTSWGAATWAGDEVAVSNAGDVVAGTSYLMRLSAASSATWISRYHSGGGVAISADGSRVALDDHTYSQIYVVDGAGGSELGAWPTNDLVHDLAMSANGTTIVAGGYAGVDVLDGTADHLWSYPAAGTTQAVAVSADGSRIVAGCGDAKVRLWNRGSSTPVWTYDQHSGGIFGVAISANGSTVASIGDWGAVSLVNAATGAPIWEYRPDAGFDTNSIDISDDGSRIAVGTMDGVLFFVR
jgi:hypothetical protein